MVHGGYRMHGRHVVGAKLDLKVGGGVYSGCTHHQAVLQPDS